MRLGDDHAFRDAFRSWEDTAPFDDDDEAPFDFEGEVGGDYDRGELLGDC